MISFTTRIKVRRWITSLIPYNWLIAATEELRIRGNSVAIYGADDLAQGPLFDEPEYPREAIEAFYIENADAIEDAMTDAVWKFCEGVELKNGKLEHVYGIY